MSDLKRFLKVHCPGRVRRTRRPNVYCLSCAKMLCYSEFTLIIGSKRGICKSCLDHSPKNSIESDELAKSVGSSQTPIDSNGCPASLVADNIKLVYLKQSLVNDLMKEQPHCWKSKLMGNYVRVKTDPRDYSKSLYQYHQLAQVQGIYKKSSTSDFLSQVVTGNNVTRDIPVSQISDANFTEEECEDLRRDVGNCRHLLMRRASVFEFEQKARELHEDLTKHWIKRELVRLQKLIDWTNEKGRRGELDDYLDQRELFKQACEQEILMKQVLMSSQTLETR